MSRLRVTCGPLGWSCTFFCLGRYVWPDSLLVWSPVHGFKDFFFLLCVFFRCPPFHAATNREKQQRILHVSPLFVAKTLPEYNAFQFEFGGVWNYLVTRILINSHFSSFI
jgi:hypothetical protein